MEIITMEINYFTFIILGIIYLIFFRKNNTKQNETNSQMEILDDMKKRLKALQKGQERREQLIAQLDKKEQYKNKYPSEFDGVILIDESGTEEYKELVKPKKNHTKEKNLFSFPDNLETKKLKKKLKQMPRNILFKEILLGKPIACKTLTKFNHDYKWYIVEIKDNKALGFFLRKDDYGNLALVKTFYVSINEKQEISLINPTYSHPAYKVSEFLVDETVSIKYYQTYSSYAEYTYDFYPIENIEITLY